MFQNSSLPSDGTNVTHQDYQSLFASSDTTRCPITSYSITQVGVTTPFSGSLLTMMTLDATTLNLSQELPVGTEFSIMAENAKQVRAWKNFNVQYIVPEPETTTTDTTTTSTESTTETIIAAIVANEAPAFKDEIITTVSIIAEKGLDGEIKDSSIYTYKSPVAEDNEGDSISFGFTGIDGFIAASLKKNSDSTFTLRIDPSLITETKTYSATVSIGDDQHPNAVTKVIEIVVEYTEEQPPAEEETESNTESSSTSTSDTAGSEWISQDPASELVNECDSQCELQK